MNTRARALSILVVIATISEVSLCKVDKTAEVSNLLSQLKEGKQRAEDLVKEIESTDPDHGDLLVLRRKYNATREAYAAWSDEAAEAVGAGRNIDLGSEKAQRAKEALNNLASFANEYVAQQERLRSSASRLNSGAGDEIKELAGFVKAHWQQIEAVAKAIKKWRTGVQEERNQRAKQVQEAGDWLKFEDIK